MSLTFFRACFVGPWLRRHTCMMMSVAALLTASPLRLHAQSFDASLPEAPLAAAERNASAFWTSPPAWNVAAETDDALASTSQPARVTGPDEPSVLPRDCPYDRTRSRLCRVHVRQLVISTAMFNAFQNAGNLYTGYWYRYETTHGKWWDRYVNSVEGWRWDLWSDGNPMLDVYVGHPIMGSITNFLWIQNDPRSMTLEQENSWPYYRRILRAGAFSTFYSFEWKLGPLGEASIGHNGDHYFSDEKGKVYTNETGWVELVTTPVGGMLWTMAEDALDKHVVRRLEGVSRNPVALTFYQFLSPSRGTANILRFRPPWYRDTRVVRANSFFSDPTGADDELRSETATTAAAERDAPDAAAEPMARTAMHPTPREGLPVFPRPGGVHEFGAWWGLSLISGHVFGTAHDIKYMPIDVRYSYEMARWQHLTLRYSPELTALAMVDQPHPGATDPMLKRTRAYGSGLSPAGFQVDLLPDHRVQPFLSTNAGLLYFDKPILSPQGTELNYIVDAGFGVNVFRKARQAVSIGYRYQYLANMNNNGRTDANTFYVSVSRFRTKGYR